MEQQRSYQTKRGEKGGKAGRERSVCFFFLISEMLNSKEEISL